MKIKRVQTMKKLRAKEKEMAIVSPSEHLKIIQKRREQAKQRILKFRQRKKMLAEEEKNALYAFVLLYSLWL